MHPPRRITAALLALLVAGCDHRQERELATVGPEVLPQLQRDRRQLSPADRIALQLRGETPDPAALQACILRGLVPALPPGQPEPAWIPDETQPALRAEGYGWLAVVEDHTTTGPVDVHAMPLTAGAGGLGFGFNTAHPTGFHLNLEAALTDLRSNRRAGSITARYEAFEQHEVVIAIVGGAGGALPLIIPASHLPGGRDAMAICEAFGRVIGRALMQANEPDAARDAEPTVPSADQPAKPPPRP